MAPARDCSPRTQETLLEDGRGSEGAEPAARSTASTLASRDRAPRTQRRCGMVEGRKGEGPMARAGRVVGPPAAAVADVVDGRWSIAVGAVGATRARCPARAFRSSLIVAKPSRSRLLTTVPETLRDGRWSRPPTDLRAWSSRRAARTRPAELSGHGSDWASAIVRGVTGDMQGLIRVRDGPTGQRLVFRRVLTWC
jgi:hypothetical protein